jgi:hypothetical protein
MLFAVVLPLFTTLFKVSELVVVTPVSKEPFPIKYPVAVTFPTVMLFDVVLPNEVTWSSPGAVVIKVLSLNCNVGVRTFITASVITRFPLFIFTF